MDGSKSIFASKTFWGALLAGASALLGIFGVDVAEGEKAALIEGVTAVGAVVGTLLAIYGRFKANSKIG